MRGDYDGATSVLMNYDMPTTYRTGAVTFRLGYSLKTPQEKLDELCDHYLPALGCGSQAQVLLKRPRKQQETATMKTH
jgi:hypothetical protein